MSPPVCQVNNTCSYTVSSSALLSSSRPVPASGGSAWAESISIWVHCRADLTLHLGRDSDSVGYFKIHQSRYLQLPAGGTIEFLGRRSECCLANIWTMVAGPGNCRNISNTLLFLAAGAQITRWSARTEQNLHKVVPFFSQPSLLSSSSVW